jgi:putative PIG3 family NAD(P)H quinone oxidoreductase
MEISRPGGPDVLRAGQRSLPGLLRDEVRIQVHASGVNRADLLQRRGSYPPPSGDPQDVPGLEFAGIVVEAGAACRVRQAGDRVMGILGSGGYAESLVVTEAATIRVPHSLSLTDAGAIPEVFITAWDALFRQAHLQPGETVLIHAVGSGVGTAALQLSRAAGARTVGTSRTPEKVERALALGLDHGIVVRPGDDWVSEARHASGGAGVDVLFDLVGGSYAEGNLAVLGEEGRWVVVGIPGGQRGVLDLWTLMTKRLTLRGTVLRGRSPGEKATLARAFERTVVPLFERGVLRPVVDMVLPAAQAAEAHRYLEANQSFGKVVLSWSTDAREGP